MKYCYRCGKQLPDIANFCDGCGTKQIVKPLVEDTQKQLSMPKVVATSPVKNETKPKDDENIWGILALIFAFVSPVIGFILGIVGTQRIKDHKSKYYQMSFASIFVAIVVVIVWIVLLILFYFGIIIVSFASWARGVGGGYEILSSMW